MSPLSTQDIIRVWEAGQGKHLTDQALIILTAASPEKSWEELSKLSIGQRDDILISIREQTFGSRFTGLAECVTCNESLEFSFDAADIRVTSDTEQAEELHQATCGEYDLCFRLPNSLDLAAVSSSDRAEARNLLIQRCILRGSWDGVEISAEKLPEEVISQVSALMSELDPWAEILLNLDCPACGHRWQIIFDIATYFWTEIFAQARRLLREVHTLALAYGWSEADILSMSTARRQFYLEAVS